MYGNLGVSALDDMFVEIEREKFSACKILREVDMDGGLQQILVLWMC